MFKLTGMKFQSCIVWCWGVFICGCWIDAALAAVRSKFGEHVGRLVFLLLSDQISVITVIREVETWPTLEGDDAHNPPGEKRME